MLPLIPRVICLLLFTICFSRVCQGQVGNAVRVKAACEKHWKEKNQPCNQFAIAVARELNIQIPQSFANGIIDFLVRETQKSDPIWYELSDGVQAQKQAGFGRLVIAGLRAADHHDSKTKNGHVAVVVSGPLKHGKYPRGYWGALKGKGRADTSLSLSWKSEDKDNVRYFSTRIRTVSVVENQPLKQERLPQLATSQRKILVLLDVSGSMNSDNKLKFANQGAIAAVNASSPNDAFALITFGGDCKNGVVLQQSWTADRALLLKSITAVKAGGATPLAPALSAAANYLGSSGATPASTGVVLLADGEDSCGGLKKSLELLTKNHGFKFHFETIGVGVKDDAGKQLEAIATSTEGSYQLVKNANQSAAAISAAFKNLRRYIFER